MDGFRDYGRGLVDTLLRGVSTQGGQLAIQRLVTASALPFLASIVWHFSHTVVEVTDGEQSKWLQCWLAQQRQALSRVRRLLLVSAGSMMGSRTSRRQRMMYGMEDNDGDEKEVGDRFSPPKLIETPSTCVLVWTWFGWYPVSIERRSSSVVGAYPGDMTPHSSYAITVWFAPNGAEIAKELILKGRLFWQSKRASKTEILMAQEGYHPVEFKVVTRPSRPLSSVIVDGSKKEHLLHDAMQFLQGEKWYVCKGIPYRRGYLLYGKSTMSVVYLLSLHQ